MGLSRSIALLPTAPAAYYLGNVAKDRSDQPKAMEYTAPQRVRRVPLDNKPQPNSRIDLPKNPGNYVATAGQFDAQGRHFVVVQNRSPVALTNIQVTPVLINSAGQIVQQGSPVRLSNALESGEQMATPSGIARISQGELPYLRFRIDGAQVME